MALAHQSRAISASASQPRNAGTQYCLLGRLTQRDGRTRVIVRLVDAATNRNIWGDSFDGSANDPFELQDRVVDGVLCGTVSRIFATQIEWAHSKDPKDLVVHDLAMRALMLILRTDVPSARRAMGILNHAIELDPGECLAGCVVGMLSRPAFYLSRHVISGLCARYGFGTGCASRGLG